MSYRMADIYTGHRKHGRSLIVHNTFAHISAIELLTIINRAESDVFFQ
jgi:hypothetical protein